MKKEALNQYNDSEESRAHSQLQDQVMEDALPLHPNASVRRRQPLVHNKVTTLIVGAVCCIISSGPTSISAFSNHHRTTRISSTFSYSTPSFVSLSASRQEMDFGMDRSIPSIKRRRDLLSKDEEKALLEQSVEYRRIRAIQADSDSNSLSACAEIAGYGTDLDRYEEAQRMGQLARESLVTHNMGLVHSVVQSILKRKNKIQLQSLSTQDLIQEGAIGLARAVDKWDESRDNMFGTYATYWIRAYVQQCISERDDLMRVPDHVSRAVLKMTQAARRLGWDYWNDNHDGDTSLFSDPEKMAAILAQEAGLTPAQLRHALAVSERRKAGGYASFEPWMHRETTTTISSENDIEVDDLKNAFSQFLRPNELMALSLRYGLSDHEDSFSSLDQAIATPQETSKPPTVRLARDYEAEAEYALFGPAGMLANTEEEAQASPVSARKQKRKTTKRQTSPSTTGRWGEAMSFAEVGNRMAVSGEYGRRLCMVALQKLQLAAQEGRLQPEFLY